MWNEDYQANSGGGVQRIPSIHLTVITHREDAAASCRFSAIRNFNVSFFWDANQLYTGIALHVKLLGEWTSSLSAPPREMVCWYVVDEPTFTRLRQRVSKNSAPIIIMRRPKVDHHKWIAGRPDCRARPRKFRMRFLITSSVCLVSLLWRYGWNMVDIIFLPSGKQYLLGLPCKWRVTSLLLQWNWFLAGRWRPICNNLHTLFNAGDNANLNSPLKS